LFDGCREYLDERSGDEVAVSEPVDHFAKGAAESAVFLAIARNADHVAVVKGDTSE
jgi:hypothetical protein